MRALAQYAMSGRRQAITAAFLCGLIPLMNVITPAILGLVLLRHGWRETLLVTAWAAIPLVGWALVGDITSLSLLIGVIALAAVLRRTSSWQYTLLAAILVGVFSELLLRLSPQFLDSLQLQVEALMAAGSVPDQEQIPPEMMRGVLVSMFGLMNMVLSICLLMLARWWQALLYNPGGFQQEFHQFRLQPAVAAMLLGLIVLAASGTTVLTGWLLYFFVPLFVAGLALVHGLIGLKKLSRLWLVAFYMLVLNPPLAQLLSVAALLDSWYDFRARVKAAEGPSS